MKAMKIEITHSHSVTRFGDLKEGEWFTNSANLDLWVKLTPMTIPMNAVHLMSRKCGNSFAPQAFEVNLSPTDIVYPVEVTITAKRV